eukprot:CAMPEP_0201701338 /NCGR_PEP_ID=MMETSP0578-20130828/32171_1 /ASSEMBLY_ACC=CAM_ASM_000663 /TAXON_ID=267565 /ORGANISM="Skeletonema grethea, Strain CCMP 1804" /LENGTH=585 /DNA_ID=CAMNT_0048188633 /DNA_START=122 /DNA_END=1879 /DNA_ORIENTATION=-
MPKGKYDRSQTKKHVTASIPSIKDACQQFPNEESAIAFLVSHGILTAAEEVNCVACGYHGCRRKSKATPKSLKCNKKDCGKSQSLVVKTVFANSKMPLHQILYIAVFFLFQSPAATVVSQLHCSSRTVNDFYQLFRQMIRKVLEVDGAFKAEDHVDAASASATAANDKDAEKKKEADDLQALAIWRQMNSESMWEAFLVCLKRVTYDSKEGFKVVKEAAAPVDANEVAAATAAVAAATTAAAAASAAATTGAAQGGDPPALPPIEDFMETGSEDIIGVAEAIIDINPNQKKKGGKRKAGEGAAEEVVNRQFTEESQPADTKRHKASTSIPSFMDICCLVPDEKSAISFLTARGVFPNPKEVICAHCGYKGFRHKGKKTPKYIKCNRCSKGQSLMKGTLFEKSRVPLHQALYMALFWLSMSSASTVIAQLGCSSATVTEFFGKFRAHAKRCLDASPNPALENRDPEQIEQQMKVHIPRYARKNEKAHNDHFSAAMWRDLNVNNLWGAFVESLKTIKYNHDLDNESKKVFVLEDGTACCKYHLKQGVKGKEPKQQPLQPSQQELEDIAAPALPALESPTIPNDEADV